MRHLLDDEGGEDAVGAGENLRMGAVEDKQADADQEEDRELEEDDHAGGEQRQAGLAQIAGGQHALDHELIRPVRGHGEEGSTQDAGPEGIGLGQVQGEVEHVELPQRRGRGVDVAPAAGNVRAERIERDESSGDVERHLDHVGPDDSGHPAFEGVEQGQRGDDRDRHCVAGTDGYGDDNGDGEDADSLGGGAGEQE